MVGASPEILVRQEKRGDERIVTIRPLAGTRPRGNTPERDAELATELLNDPKEIAEHVMLIDLARNDVGRIAQDRSVVVTDKMVIEKYSHVQHIVSSVEGKLKHGTTNFDVLRATFPAGTLSGAPKVRAMEIIDELEPVKRGLYGGACRLFVVHRRDGSRHRDPHRRDSQGQSVCAGGSGYRGRFGARIRMARDREQGAGRSARRRTGARRPR